VYKLVIQHVTQPLTWQELKCRINGKHRKNSIPKTARPKIACVSQFHDNCTDETPYAQDCCFEKEKKQKTANQKNCRGQFGITNAETGFLGKQTKHIIS